MNSDGLPDRLYEFEFPELGAEVAGIVVFLNKNGKGWALAEEDANGDFHCDGVNTVCIVDESGDAYRGYIDKKHDFIDMNGDGFLDRVVGDPDNGKFTVYFYTGIGEGETFAYLSPAFDLYDPVPDYGDDFSGTGHISNSHSNTADNGFEYSHTFLMDMNGDNLPDRLSLYPRDFSSGSKTYTFYPMLVNSLTFSDSPSEWTDQNVNQPIGALKSVNNGNGAQTVIEYMPSSWPTQWSSAYTDLPITHRFLPFNMYLVHKLYSTDWSLSGSDTDVEAQRNPFMRWVTYWYEGGNFFVKHATGSDDLFVQFNGFQTVEKIPFKSVDDTYEEFWTTTVYHQALGDVYPVASADEVEFSTSAYAHFALSGKPYTQKVTTASYTVTSEESGYSLNNSDAAETFDCDDSYCFPRLTSHSKTVAESGGTQTRYSRVEMDHDDYGNIKSEVYYNPDGSVFLEKETACYGPEVFATSLQIRDRPQYQLKTDGSTTLRRKDFSYDSFGNPEVESVEDGSGVTLSTTRVFNADGTVDTITGMDGVTKVYGYDADGLFPVTETVALPSGGSLMTQREYNRYLGKPDYTEDNAGAATETVYDGFMRPTSEYIIDTSGNAQKLKEYTYEYVSVSIEFMPEPLTVLKTLVYEPQPGHADTETNPMVMTYADASGFVLQSCHYAERGNYRLVQQRLENGGRTEITTEPVFATSCDFLSTISASVTTYETRKDLQGRIVYQENPDGDTGSPVGDVSIAYSVDADGKLVKTITDTNLLTRVESYDDQERLVKVRDPIGTEMEYAYNGIGDLTDVTVGSQTLTHIDYDELGRKTSMTDANLGTWSYGYDPLGRLETQTDNKGNVIGYDYDSLGRVTDKYYYDESGSLERSEEYAYDSGDGSHDVTEGELFSVSELAADGTLLRSTQFGYSSDYRRVDKITKNIVDLGELTQTVSHNYLGQVTGTVYPGGASVYYEYNRVGALNKICSDSACDTSLNQVYYTIDDNDYDEFGSLLKESFGNGVAHDYSYYASSHRLKGQTPQTESLLKQGNVSEGFLIITVLLSVYCPVMALLWWIEDMEKEKKHRKKGSRRPFCLFTYTIPLNSYLKRLLSVDSLGLD